MQIKPWLKRKLGKSLRQEQKERLEMLKIRD
jgi:hypothetical protein